jgi:eukaryotic-like serine/threonine-protein kinase
MHFQVGDIFGDYVITGILGAGRTGHVYKVEHCLTKRTEVMKILNAEFATETQIKRFEREMRVLARLSHPNIAGLHNAVHSEKQMILLMEYVEGETLESMLAVGRLPIDTGIGFIKQLLLALQYAHQQGVVHRDVTPANVIITNESEAKLREFGLSKSFGDSLLTNCGEIMGALPYLAPEQLKGVTQPDRRSDLYSTGAILYEHLTGQKPFGSNRRLAPVLTDSEAEPVPPSQLERRLPAAWDQILRRALDRNPEHRYQSAQEFLEAIIELDEAIVPEIRLPYLNKLALGAAILAGVVVALAVSPAIKSLAPVATMSVPSERLHIAPPAFATSVAPPPIAPQETQPRLAKRVVHPAKSALANIEPPVASPAVAAPESVASVAPPDAPPVPESTESIAPQALDNPAPAQPKKSFWGKINVFKKKKNIDASEKP